MSEVAQEKVQISGALAQPARPAEIDVVLNDQDAAITRLQEMVQALEQRLGPILRPPMPEVDRNPNGPPREPPNTNIGQRIDENSGRLQLATNQLQGLVHRLEV